MTERLRADDRPLVLLAEDDRSLRLVLTTALEEAGFAVEAVATRTALQERLGRGLGDVLVTDVLMPDGSGLDLLPEIAARRPDLKTIVISAHSTLSTAIAATRGGAFDYLAKPFDLDSLIDAVQRALAERRPHGSPFAADRLGQAGGSPLVGRSPAMQTLFRNLARVVETELTVLILGESGTGKDLIARLIHDLGPRRGRPYVAINMAAIPATLIESELFGHEKGAFTGADRRKIGRFEQAEDGTLFLDEIGDMPLEAQTRLLRVLEEGRFTRLGGREQIAARARIVAATHQPLDQLIADGRFRSDLYFRLNVVPLVVPPLRARREDIPELARHFLAEAIREGLPERVLDDAAIARLKRHDWPGNVRELRNLMRRLALFARGRQITTADVEAALAADRQAVRAIASGRAGAEEGSAAPPPAPPAAKLSSGEGQTRILDPTHSLEAAVRWHLKRYFAQHSDDLPPTGLYERVMREVERPLLELTLDLLGHNQLRTAELLGLNRNTLRKKLKDLGIWKPRRRP